MPGLGPLELPVTFPAPPSPARPALLRTLGHPRMRGALLVSLGAFILHLVPFLLPRNMPAQELSIARVTEDVRRRILLLSPLRDHPKATGADLREAAALLTPDAPAEARALADEALKRDPTVESYLLVARLCQLERMERCTRTTVEAASARFPSDARVDLLAADLREGQGDRVGALEAVGRARSKAPHDPGLALRHARLLEALGQREAARALLKPLEATPLEPRQLVELAVLRAQQDEGDSARLLLERAVKQAPRLALAHYHLGATLLRLGRTEAAEQSFREADRLDLGDPRALTALCTLQQRTGRREAARITRMDLERRFPAQARTLAAGCARASQ